MTLWDEKIVEKNTLKKEWDKAKSMTSYAQALNEALSYKMSTDDSVFLLGQGIDDPTAMFGITKGLKEIYGSMRIFDTPVSEEGMTGICNGAALSGMRPVYFHNRPDFLLLAFNQIVNHGSKIHWMDHGKHCVPLVIWSAIGRGWGSGPQHSQAIQGLLLGVPGIKIIMPSNPYDAKGLMISSIEDNNPVFIFEHRWLMHQKAEVPKEPYRIPIGKGIIRQKGTACTIVGTSHVINLAWTAVKQLKVEAEVIDLRTIKPIDETLILESVIKTGKLLVVDTGWMMGGITAEISALVVEKGFAYLKRPIRRIGLPDCPAPTGDILEHFYYPSLEDMKKAIGELIQ